MTRRRPLRILAALVATLGLGGTALAQTAACERYRAELSSLNRSGSNARAFAAAAERQSYELARLTGYYRSIGCEQGSIFFQPPLECGAIAQRIRATQSNLAMVSGQAVADPEAIESRRRQLRAAIAKACDGAEDTPRVSLSGETRLVCVRACDGYFFPLQNRPEGGASAESLCRALCPNAEVSVYRAPKDGGIEGAVSESGKPYMQLANALRFQKTVDASCSCRRPGQSWAQALQKAETMIARRSTDLVVTAALADQLSRSGLKTQPADKAHRRPTDLAKASATPRPTTTPDVETTGSTQTGTAQTPPEANREIAIPRVIAPEIVAVPRRD